MAVVISRNIVFDKLSVVTSHIDHQHSISITKRLPILLHHLPCRYVYGNSYGNMLLIQSFLSYGFWNYLLFEEHSCRRLQRNRCLFFMAVNAEVLFSV